VKLKAFWGRRDGGQPVLYLGPKKRPGVGEEGKKLLGKVRKSGICLGVTTVHGIYGRGRKAKVMGIVSNVSSEWNNYAH